jgi:predicted phage terminase large subunit-like protein
VKLGRDVHGMLYVLDVIRERVGPYEVEQLLQNTASADGYQTTVGFGKDPGQAGKWQASYLVRGLMGYTVLPEPETGDKTTRFGPFSSQCRAGNVKILRGEWNDVFFCALEAFPETKHDDDVACSGALELLTTNAVDFGMYARLGGIAGRDGSAEMMIDIGWPPPLAGDVRTFGRPPGLPDGPGGNFNRSPFSLFTECSMVRGWKRAQLRLRGRSCVFDGAEVWSHRTQADRRNPLREGRGQAVGLYSRLLWRRTTAR